MVSVVEANDRLPLIDTSFMFFKRYQKKSESGTTSSNTSSLVHPGFDVKFTTRTLLVSYIVMHFFNSCLLRA
jgi:hypothetical protein